MTSKGVMSNNLASASLFEPFGRTFVRFHFGHGNVLGINGRYSFDNHTIACGWDLARFQIMFVTSLNVDCDTVTSCLNPGSAATILQSIRYCDPCSSPSNKPWKIYDFGRRASRLALSGALPMDWHHWAFNSVTLRAAWIDYLLMPKGINCLNRR